MELEPPDEKRCVGSCSPLKSDIYHGPLIWLSVDNRFSKWSIPHHEIEMAKRSRRSRHPKKEVEGAVVYSELAGWTVEMLSGHAWGKILCPWNDCDCRCGTFCQISIWSTPKVPEHMAERIRKAVNGCIHRRKKGDGCGSIDERGGKTD